jgi:hypothetical protein
LRAVKIHLEVRHAHADVVEDEDAANADLAGATGGVGGLGRPGRDRAAVNELGLAEFEAIAIKGESGFELARGGINRGRNRDADWIVAITWLAAPFGS